MYKGQVVVGVEVDFDFDALRDEVESRIESVWEQVATRSIVVEDGPAYLQVVADVYNDLFATTKGLEGFKAFVVSNSLTRSRPAKYPYGGKVIAQDAEDTVSVSMAYPGIPVRRSLQTIDVAEVTDMAVSDIAALLRMSEREISVFNTQTGATKDEVEDAEEDE